MFNNWGNKRRAEAGINWLAKAAYSHNGEDRCVCVASTLTECGFITGNVCENLCTCGTADTEAENPRWLEFLGSQAKQHRCRINTNRRPKLNDSAGCCFIFIFSVQCRTRVTECWGTIYMALISSVWSLVRTEKMIHGYSSLSRSLLSIRHIIDRTWKRNLCSVRTDERGIKMVHLQFDRHTRWLGPAPLCLCAWYGWKNTSVVRPLIHPQHRWMRHTKTIYPLT